jgi:hypothetical protein
VRTHEPLVHWTIPPELSETAQKVVVGQDTLVGVGPPVEADAAGSIGDRADHASPFHWSAPPDWSTAVQNETVGQETPANEAASSKDAGWDQVSPFHCEMPPEVDMHKEEEAQEIADTDPQSPLVPVHPPPLNAKAFPSASTVAQYWEGAQPTASRPLAPSMVTGADQP